MKSFRYAFDPLCLSACLLYVVNRWLIASLPGNGRFFASTSMICFSFLPPFRLFLGFRDGLDSESTMRPPSLAEIFGHLFIWSLISELLGPFVFARSVGDLLDVLAYSAGALAAGVWWNRKSLASRVARRLAIVADRAI